jgi:predicted metal-dependent hydrolase
MSTIKYTIDRSFSRKHTYITIQKDGSVLIKTNPFTSIRTIENFISQKEQWIQQKQNAIYHAIQQIENHFYLFGKLQPRNDLTQKDIDTLYLQKSKEIIPPLVTQYSEHMQLYPSRISFRRNKTRWGSCSSKNNLSFNTMLIQTPLTFIEYVVVHELAHIKYKNHSQNFWNLVEEILPDYQQRRKSIKEHYIL